MREASWAAAGMLSPAPDCPAAIPLVPLGRASLALYPKFIAAVEEASGLRTGLSRRRHDRSPVPRRCGTRTEHAGGAPSWIGPRLRTAAARRSAEDGACARTRRARGRVASRRSLGEPRALTAAVLAAAKAAGATLCPGVEVISLVERRETLHGRENIRGRNVFARGTLCSPQAAGHPNSARPRPMRRRVRCAARWSPCGIRQTHPARAALRARLHRAARPASPQKLVVGSTLENAGYEKRVTSGGIEQILSAVNEFVPELAARKSSRPGAACAPALRINCRFWGRRIWKDW